jgi:endoglucanase
MDRRRWTLPRLLALAISFLLLATDFAGSSAARSQRRAGHPSVRKTRKNRNPFAGRRFYVDPRSDAAKTERQLAAAGNNADAQLMRKISSQPSAQWFGSWSYGHGGTSGDVNWWVSTVTSAGALPVLVAYDLPGRNCGGAGDAAYQGFIDGMAHGIGNRAAVVILEPDALPQMGCATLLRYAVATLRSAGRVSVYVDAGHAKWQSASTIASKLRAADVAQARGFSLNVANFDSNSSEIAYGSAISHALGGGVPFIIDTGRNGRGAPAGNAWCNPPGRGLGSPPTSLTGNPLVDAFFWIKSPGHSDGACNGGPSAGQWWPAYALTLASNAVP